MVKTQSNQREVISEITATEVNSVNDYVFIDFSYLEMFNIKGVYKINLFFKKDIPMIANIEDTNSKLELLIAPRVGEEF